mmetsp:Transcript_138328/g.442058  ORF Transcript_138328/g.442058 Transcript_138328/m.442058 type:complete len:241 (+) Transcript_138328:180-902(+)
MSGGAPRGRRSGRRRSERAAAHGERRAPPHHRPCNRNRRRRRRRRRLRRNGGKMRRSRALRRPRSLSQRRRARRGRRSPRPARPPARERPPLCARPRPRRSRKRGEKRRPWRANRGRGGSKHHPLRLTRSLSLAPRSAQPSLGALVRRNPLLLARKKRTPMSGLCLVLPDPRGVAAPAGRDPRPGHSSGVFCLLASMATARSTARPTETFRCGWARSLRRRRNRMHPAAKEVGHLGAMLA